VKLATLHLAAVLLLSATALAQDAHVEQAKMYFNAGAKAYSDGHYDAAIQMFEEAYKAAPRPAILFSMAQAERKQYYVKKQPEVLLGAVKHYHAYLDQVPTGGRRDDAATALAELEPIASRLSPEAAEAQAAASPVATRIMVSSQTSSAVFSIDGAPTKDVPLMVDVKPGKHKVRVLADGFVDEERAVSVSPGGTAPVEITLRERPALLSVKADDGADVVVDGRMLGTTPLPRPLEVPSGAHFIALLKNGHKAFTREVTLERAKGTTVTAHFETTGQRVVSYGFLGAGVVGLVAGGVFVGVTLYEQGQAQNVLDRMGKMNLSPPDLDTYNHAVDARDMWRTASVVTLGVSVVALATGLTLYAFDKPTPGIVGPPQETPKPNAPPPPREPSMEMSAIPLVGPGVVGAGVIGRF
jgi:hypothetical protein